MLRSTLRRPRSLVALVIPIAGAVAAACVPGAGPALLPDEVEPGGLDLDDDKGPVRIEPDLGDPFAIEGLTPSHGPFTGGTRVRIDGRGFSSKLRVFIGGVEVDASSLLASDPTRAAIITPPGPPGFVDVRILDEAAAKERVLVDGFYYDAFVVSPDSGATSGGTRVALTGSGTSWGAGTTVAIGGVPCVEVEVTSPTRLQCLTPEGTPGSKDVVVTTLGGEGIQARDAFTYTDSVDGYRGGLSGGALSGRVKVLAFNSMLGTPLPGAFAIAGGDLATATVQRTGPNGVTEIADVSGDEVTITVAAKCHHPITFVDVPVDTVTAYLDPVLDPSCIEGDPPSSIPGGRMRYGGFVEGQLVFPGGKEFQRAGWSNVPLPTKPTERRAAYVFEASPSPNATFQLPPPSEAITPDSEGSVGYGYSLLVYPGNATVYVVAGIEDRSETPPKFLPYTMGVARGLSVPAQARVQGVDVMMNILFDHQVTIAASPPAPGPRGPDRFTAQVALTLGAGGYAILPRGTRTTTLPAPEQIPFVGVPALDHAISGEQYVIGGVAATGPGRLLPASVVSRVRTTNANTPVSLGGFLGVPVAVQPGAGAWSGTHVEIAGASGPVDLSVIQVSSGGGLVTWTIVAPGGARSFSVPDLATLPDSVGLVRGPINTAVSVARIEPFDYGRLRYGHLSSGSWTAHAVDSVGGAY